MKQLAKFVKPNTKEFTVAQLRKIEVPEFQRWIIPANKMELKSSMEEVGMLRCPVIAHVRELDKTFIIDGNHMRLIILEDETYKDDDRIVCIYNEVETYSDAAMQFQLLNTKGKQLDWVDITNLYRHVYGAPSIYNDIWSLFLGSPAKPDEVRKHKGFTVPTIVEFLVSDKAKYRDGEYKTYTSAPKDYVGRKNLLSYLLHNANESWDKLFPNGKSPSGASILGFANFWFSNKLHQRFGEGAFLTMVNNIYQDYQKPLNDGTMVINRDNAGSLLKQYLKDQDYKDLKLS